MDCPRDNTEMSELTDGEERLLSRCAECGGLWVDVADLNRILLHAGLPTLEQARERLRDALISIPWEGLKLSAGDPALPVTVIPAS